MRHLYLANEFLGGSPWLMGLINFILGDGHGHVKG